MSEYQKPQTLFIPKMSMRDDEEEDKMEDIELARKGFDQFQDTVTSFIRSQLSTKREVQVQSFENNQSIFGNYKGKTKVFQALPPLYFMPKIMIINDGSSLQELHKKLLQYALKNKKEAEIEVYFRKKMIQISIHGKSSYQTYHIKSIKLHPKIKPQFQDHVLILNPLLQFYKHKHRNFKETLQLILYWGYLKNMINHQYVPLEGFYILIISFFCHLGCRNVVWEYYLQNQGRIQKMKQMYEINYQNGNEKICQQLFKYEDVTVQYKRGFLGKFSNQIVQILPVPFSNLCQYSQKYEEQNYKEYESSFLFFKFFYFLEQFIIKPKTLTFDLRMRNGYKYAYSKKGFNMEIIHPVYHHNVCSDLSSSFVRTSKFRNQIQKLIKKQKKYADKLEALKKILLKQ